MLTSIEIDGVLYHAQQEYDDDNETYREITPVLDEDGGFIYLLQGTHVFFSRMEELQLSFLIAKNEIA